MIEHSLAHLGWRRRRQISVADSELPPVEIVHDRSQAETGASTLGALVENHLVFRVTRQKPRHLSSRGTFSMTSDMADSPRSG